jgi:hypothetical protein
MKAQLHAGVWFRHLQAAKNLAGNQGTGAQIWHSAFGYQVETWCAAVAECAANARWFKPKLILPSHPGARDEIEDVILVEGRTAVLFSVKSRLVVENVARGAKSRSGLIDWYEKYFFGTKTEKHRKGVAHLLNDRINLIRAGEFAPRLPATTRIIPVLVSYDSLCEHTVWYQWFRDRCAEHGVFRQKDVSPPTIARVDEFEMLMAIAQTGESIVALLRHLEKGWKNRRLGELLYDRRYKRQRQTPLPIITETFDELGKGAVRTLFDMPTTS